jgi:signal peptidase
MEDRKKKRKIFTVIINVISYILLLILAVYVVMHFIFPRHVIKIFRFQHITVLTDSMEPVINVDDVIIIKKLLKISILIV